MADKTIDVAKTKPDDTIAKLASDKTIAGIRSLLNDENPTAEFLAQSLTMAEMRISTICNSIRRLIAEGNEDKIPLTSGQILTTTGVLDILHQKYMDRLKHLRLPTALSDPLTTETNLVSIISILNLLANIAETSGKIHGNLETTLIRLETRAWNISRSTISVFPDYMNKERRSVRGKFLDLAYVQRRIIESYGRDFALSFNNETQTRMELPCDPLAVTASIVGMIKNARKAIISTPNPEPILHITFKTRSDEHLDKTPKLLVAIHDDGQGIDPQLRWQNPYVLRGGSLDQITEKLGFKWQLVNSSIPEFRTQQILAIPLLHPEA